MTHERHCKERQKRHYIYGVAARKAVDLDVLHMATKSINESIISSLKQLRFSNVIIRTMDFSYFLVSLLLVALLACWLLPLVQAFIGIQRFGAAQLFLAIMKSNSHLPAAVCITVAAGLAAFHILKRRAGSLKRFCDRAAKVEVNGNIVTFLTRIFS